MRPILNVIPLVVVLAMPVQQADAQGTYSIRRSAFAAAGGASATSSYVLRFTFGEPVAGKEASPGFVANSGFWGGGSARPCLGDINIDGTVDFNDLLEFLNWLNSSDPRADLNRDGSFDFNDLLEFLNRFNDPC